MENAQGLQDYKPRGKYKRMQTILPTETWTYLEDDLWLGPHGVIVNRAALDERKFYYTIVEVTG
jgi:hypothetical protein